MAIDEKIEKYGQDANSLNQSNLNTANSLVNSGASSVQKTINNTYKQQKSLNNEAYKKTNKVLKNVLTKQTGIADELNAQNNQALADLYQNQQDTINGNRARTEGVLNQNYQNALGNLKSSTESALRNAYLSNMQNQRDVNQKMSAQGLNGGMSETTLARMANNYANNQANINNQHTQSQQGIDSNYNGLIAELYNSGDTQLAAALAQYTQGVSANNTQRAQSYADAYSQWGQGKQNAVSDKYKNAIEFLTNKGNATISNKQSKTQGLLDARNNYGNNAQNILSAILSGNLKAEELDMLKEYYESLQD